MLTEMVKSFIAYGKTAGFKKKSIESLSIRLNEFKNFVRGLQLPDIRSINYEHISSFVADFRSPSVHVKKARVWALRLFFHYLKTCGDISDNPTESLPYPKIERSVPKFLTIEEYNQILSCCLRKADSFIGFRNLIIVAMLGTLGIRTGALVKLDVTDVDTTAGLLWLSEKGDLNRSLILPAVLCELLKTYLEIMDANAGPLFLSKRGKRISPRTLQEVFSSVSNAAGVQKHLHAHLFRHTAGTHLNRIGGLNVTQHILGHATSRNTRTYTHLNPDNYAIYMKRHPFMKGI